MAPFRAALSDFHAPSVTSVRRRNPYNGYELVPAVQHCDHDTFHSGQGRYSRETGELRYVLVCDACEAELRLVHSETYHPSYDPRGNEDYRKAA